jgi:predicted molibdopterin-dependent oxidoreductase YjgC
VISISSRRGSIRIAARISGRVARHQVFVPMHYREAAVNLLTNPALDPYAGIPEFKVCAVKLTPVRDDDADALATTTPSHSEPLVVPSERQPGARNAGA